MFGGMGMLLAGVVMVCVAIFLCVLFASLGILAVFGVALVAVVVTAAVSPLLLPLLIPIGLYWLLFVRPQAAQAPRTSKPCKAREAVHLQRLQAEAAGT
jgi:hypothetical protein